MSQPFVSPKRYALNREKTKAVEWGSEEADTLLVCAGGELPIAVARQYGLVPAVIQPEKTDAIGISDPVAKPNRDRVVKTSQFAKR